MTYISHDTAKIERELLLSSLKQLDQRPPNFAKKIVVWVLLGLAVLVGFALSFADLPILRSEAFRAVEPLLALGFGMFMMYMLARTTFKAQLHFLRPFIDRAEVEARIRQLGP